MANTLQTMLKAEISRLSKKEIKTAVAPLMKTTAELRKQVRDLKKQLAGYVKAAGISVPVVEEKSAPSVEKLRFNAKNIKALRLRHNMTQAEMAKALGVSKMSVSGWEQGRSKPRGETVRLAMAKLRKTRPSKASVTKSRTGTPKKAKSVAMPVRAETTAVGRQ